MIWVLTLDEVERFNKDKIMSSDLKACWETFLNELPANLLDELKTKHPEKIVMHSINRVLLPDSKYRVMRFLVPGASKELERMLDEHEYTLLVN